MIRKFIIRSAIFLLLPIIAATGFYILNAQTMTAKRVTDSYSFNEKIKWLPAEADISILTAGSSMSFNNISSDVIVKTFGTDKYVNVSSWGVRITDMALLYPMFIDLYNPEIILCASNIVDFEPSFVEYDTSKIRSFINNKQEPNIYDLLTDKYYFKHTIENRNNFTLRNMYTSLAFDNYGAVPYASKDFNIVESRWEKQSLFNQIDPKNYQNLEVISDYLASVNIEFVFIQVPVRSYLQNGEYNTNISKHCRRIRSILEPKGHVFLDFSSKKLSDEYYVDHSHLNEVGADSLTEMICRQYKLVTRR